MLPALLPHSQMHLLVRVMIAGDGTVFKTCCVPKGARTRLRGHYEATYRYVCPETAFCAELDLGPRARLARLAHDNVEHALSVAT